MWAVPRALRGETVIDAEYTLRRKDTGETWIGSYNFAPIYDEAGIIVGSVVVGRDITERKRIEKQLANALSYIQTIFEKSPIGIATFKANGQILTTNPSLAEIVGGTVEEIVNLNIHDMESWQNSGMLATAEEVLSTGIEKDREFHQISSFGKECRISCLFIPFTHESEQQLLLMMTDISERKQAEAERQKFFLLAESSSEFIGMCDLDMNPVYVNPAGRRMVGLPDMAAACRVKVQDYYFQEDQRFIAEEFFPGVMRDGHGDVEIRLRHFQTGEPIWMLYYLFSVHDESDTPVGWATVSRDITERKRAEKEKEKLQAQLIQAQKMESVGRLAGGVAHDFNNMLSIIIGHAELALEKAKPSDSLQADLMEILDAGKRSADITRQLLAFARQQTVAPKVIDLNDAIGNMLKMLRRLIGEDIALAWLPGAEVWSLKIDPSQIDQILVNLCVNARDAIENVGKITIETEDIRFDQDYCANHAGFIPGEYVMLAVSDDGSGMPPETLKKIFEPFFTTKGLGKGTGLGLATVYGIVKQNNGFINVYSEPTEGTTFKIYLPRHTGLTVEIQRKSTSEIPLGRNEMILLAEDDASILNLGKMILERLGYKVLTAITPGEALTLAKEHGGKIHLLITDVIMPGMNGRELSNQLKILYPDLKTLFMSGYTANVIAHRGILEESVCFMSKPFSKKDLAIKVREALDNGNV